MAKKATKREKTTAVAPPPAAPAPARPTTRPDWAKMFELKRAQEYAAVKLRYLEKFDRPGLVGLLRSKKLGEWLAKQGHQAAALHERLERGNIPVKDIEKDVAAILTPAIEQQSPLPPTIATELEKLLADWKRGEGQLFEA